MTTPDRKPFTGVLFDMDGLLVDSEPLWHVAEMDVLGGLGVPLSIDEARATKGMFANEVVAFWFQRYPWTGVSIDEVAVTVTDRAGDLIEERGELLPGVLELIALVAESGMKSAVASSSHYRLIHRVLKHFGITDHFELVHSAEDEPFGKPHPGVFISAAQRLGLAPRHCLVLEDSPAGVLAGKAASMTVVAVPADSERSRPEIALADVVLDSLIELDAGLLAKLSGGKGTHPLG